MDAAVAAGTFRDPTGSLFDVDDKILRLVRPAEAATFESLLAEEVVCRLIDRGDVVATRPVDASSVPDHLRSLSGNWFRHERIGFQSVPAEWSVAMLAQAALHTLDVNLELLKHGFILKDATPSNILFEGTKPVLVDVPSIQALDPGRDLWLARNQFETTFLLPLIASLDAGLPLRWSLSDPATGLGHDRLAHLLGSRRWIGLDRIRHVALPAALSGAGAETAAARARSTRRPDNLERSKFILSHSMSSLRRSVEKLASRIEKRQSNWSDYGTTRDHYSSQDLDRKREFVARVLQVAGARWVVDVGANTGEFSEMAAAHAKVVALDLDEVSVSAIYLHAHTQRPPLPIQPLVVDISQPTPPTGWKCGERRSFLQRASGRFDLALMLALVHHLRVSAGVPLAEIVDLGFSLGQKSLVMEFVPVDDPMFLRIARGRESLYTDHTPENCEALLQSRARIERREVLSNGRILFWAVQSP